MIKVLMIAAFLLLLFFLFAYGMYRAVFCYPPGRRPDVHCIPNSGLYRVHRDKMLECIADMEMTPFEEVSILSTDGLRLYGRFYRFKADALLILFFSWISWSLCVGRIWFFQALQGKRDQYSYGRRARTRKEWWKCDYVWNHGAL